ncbi:MAG: DnaD domain protein [Oscillospiraceae bacterium]|nr:DnaD domain protein [Oscillospiraceae bacterium]
MASQHIQLNIQTISMDAASADRLLRLGNGDAALLWLYLLRHQGEYDPVRAAGLMGWSRNQTETAMARLQEIGLAAGYAPEQESLPPPTPDQAPSYSASDIAEELKANESFNDLVTMVEELAGRKLTNSQLSILLELYSHVDLPLDVLWAMVNFVYARSKEKYGPGGKLSMTQVRSTGYRWKERGYDTMDAVDEYLKEYELRRTREGGILTALGVYGRKPSATESRYINQWLDWGFGPEVCARAADLTVTSIGRLDWRYCNAILRRWHEAGHHTLQAVEEAQRQSAAQKQQPGSAGAGQKPAYRQNGTGNRPSSSGGQTEKEMNRQNMLQLQRMLAQMEQEG